MDDFLSRVLKDLAAEYVMPADRFYDIWDNIRESMKWELPEPRLPNGIRLKADEREDDERPP